MLEMKNLSKVYRTEVIETYALRELSLHVREGEFVAVTGRSGSGKTTFLTIAGLLEEATSGEYRLDGVEVRGLSDAKRSRLRNEKIGFIFQAFNLLPELNVAANVELPLRYRGLPREERQRLVGESLERVGLSARARHYPSELSGGQQQRVAIARALAGSPRLLLADEPTGNLDTGTGELVLNLLLRTAHEFDVAVVMATHSAESASVADRIVHLRDGRMVEEAVPQR
jgi:putative ABC transport system ATP-binding protein